MHCPDGIIDYATSYLTVYCLGCPVLMLYNYTASILRASGDTLRPLFFLFFGGIINIVLNVFFVLVVKLPVQGVALATIISQGFSAILSIIILMKAQGMCKLKLCNLKISKDDLIELLKIGLPMGLQSAVFSLSGTLISAKVNIFGESMVAGRAVATQFTSVTANVLESLSLGALSFFSQNYGAGDYKRIMKMKHIALISEIVLGLGIGWLIYIFSDVLCGIATDSSETIRYAKMCLLVCASTQFMYGLMAVLSGYTRAMGRSLSATVISIIGCCGVRILFLEVGILIWYSPYTVLLSEGICWFFVIVCYMIYHISLDKKVKSECEKKRQEILQNNNLSTENS